MRPWIVTLARAFGAATEARLYHFAVRAVRRISLVIKLAR
jgi:hypothetical protein